MLIVDALALCYRSHFGSAGNVRDARGFDRGALEIVTRSLRELAQTDETHLAWDCIGERTFRHNLYPDYKRGRQEMPPSLRGQLPEIRREATEAGITSWIARGFEADDVMATLAAMANPAPVRLFTPDKDMLQLVDDRVQAMWYGRNGERWQHTDAAGVVIRLGVAPALVPDFLALTGDAVDGVPGLVGVGPKRAVKMLEKYGSALSAVCQDDAGSVYGNSVRLSLELVRLRNDAPVEVWK